MDRGKFSYFVYIFPVMFNKSVKFSSVGFGTIFELPCFQCAPLPLILLQMYISIKIVCISIDSNYYTPFKISSKSTKEHIMHHRSHKPLKGRLKLTDKMTRIQNPPTWTFPAHCMLYRPRLSPHQRQPSGEADSFGFAWLPLETPPRVPFHGKRIQYRLNDLIDNLNIHCLDCCVL